MAGKTSAGTIRAIELLRKGLSPWAAAKEAGVEDTTVYRSPLFLEFLNDTDGPVKAAEAIVRLRASPAWGGSQPEISPQSIAKEMSIPVLLIYHAPEFEDRVMQLLGDGAAIDDVAASLSIPAAVIKKLPRYVAKRDGENLERALKLLEEGALSTPPLLPQDVAKQLKIAVNLIYRSPAFEERVAARLEAGDSLREISEQMGIGIRAIKQLSVYEKHARKPGRPSLKKTAA